ncbi:MAG: transcriptional repressor LexA [Alphaproteobacteria bacterium]|nr:transcriptional repressor LexA [Alphaproteobacteria bacterium]
MLTKKQRDLLLYIHEKMSGDDVPPSFEEMKEALGLKSKSGIHRLITGLVERGYIERLPHRARALEIKRLPEGFRPKDEDRSAVADLSREIAATQQAALLSQVMEVPLCGRIAAGTPIEAIRDEGESVQVPPGFIGRGDHYALTVDGDSMIKAGIFDQDTVIIQRCETAENGAIVVALVDDQDVTLKRLRRAGSKIVLEPENDDYEPRVLEQERVKIQGRLAGLLRSYH